MIKFNVLIKAIKTNLMIAILCVASSCDCIHDSLDGCPPVPAKVNLNVKVKFEITDLQNRISRATTKSVTPDQYLRFIYEVYKYAGKESLTERREVTVDLLDPLQVDLTQAFSLDADKYFLLVWVDYISRSQKTDQFYGTQSLTSITFIEPFISGTDNRDCFIGGTDIDLLSYMDQPKAEVDLTLPLYRPVAKYALIANDLDKYLAKLQAQSPSPNQLQTKAETDISTYTAVIKYPGYMPNSFNVRTNQPNDSRSSLLYTSRCRQLSDSEALICFDYPLVNGTRTQAKINLQIYDNKGKLINEIEDITFPIKRDSLTVIRSDYFTHQYLPGININPGYDGSIDIVLPD